ncbi:MAG TPA: glucose 1-dehydrogenase [Candidatus Cybelea sp.]|nr:glucose 1-dehydrogenase [Candidatus Cybelea sp.]
MTLEGKVAIITGAARGLGKAYAEALAKEGAAVVVGDMRDCADTVAAVTKSGGKAIGVKLDVADMKSAAAMAEKTVASFGRIDVLVNNAALYGSLQGGRFDQLPEADWDAAMAVNVKGIWNCCKAVVPAMRKQKGGSIINITSLAAVFGLPYALHYTTSKGAVIGLTRGLARELGRDWIRVNAVAPSAVMTEGTAEFMGDKLEKAKQVIAAGQTLQRNLETGDLTGTILYLASDASHFVTGQTIMVDGGTVYL